MSTKQWLSAALVLILVLAGFGWWIFHQQRQTRPPPLTDLQVAERWLQCIDCAGPYLVRLSRKRKDQDTVVRFLRTALLRGPDSARRGRHEREVLLAWARDSVSAAGGAPHVAVLDTSPMMVHQPPPPQLTPQQARAAFVARYEQGFEATWRGRAAFALSAIGTRTALAALDSALLVPPASKGDSAVHKWIEQAKADSSLIALRQPD
jgi:hypothetical protein